MSADGRTSVWGGELLDLDAYLARIGYRGERVPTLQVLHACTPLTCPR